MRLLFKDIPDAFIIDAEETDAEHDESRAESAPEELRLPVPMFDAGIGPVEEKQPTSTVIIIDL